METNRPLPIDRQIDVLKYASLLLDLDWHKETILYSAGLCQYLRASLVALQLADKCEIHFYMLPTIFPLFTRENAALTCNGTPEPSEFAYWWPRKDYYNRELFLNWMINELTNNNLL